MNKSHFDPKTEIVFATESDMKAYFKEFAKRLGKSDVVALYGTLGAGKTTIARAIIQSLCGAGTIVQSPTFNILQVYDTSDFAIYHFDLYRLEDENEAFELGIDEALAHHLSIIEWPELFERLLPPHSIKIHLSINADNSRSCKIITN